MPFRMGRRAIGSPHETFRFYGYDATTGIHGNRFFGLNLGSKMFGVMVNGPKDAKPSPYITALNLVEEIIDAHPTFDDMRLGYVEKQIERTWLEDAMTLLKGAGR